MTYRVEGVRADVEAIREWLQRQSVEESPPGQVDYEEARAHVAALLEAVERERWVRWLVYVGDPEQPIAGFVYASDAQRYGESNYRGRYRLVQRKSDDAPAPTEPTAKKDETPPNENSIWDRCDGPEEPTA